MKILLVSTGSGSRGGGEQYLLYLSGEYARLGHDVHLLYPYHQRMDEIVNQVDPAVTVHRARLRNTYDRWFRQIGAVLDFRNRAMYRKMIRQINPDILHINQQVAEDGLDLLLAVRKLSIPAVTTIHITHSAKYLGARFAGIRDWLTHKVLSVTNVHFITVSREMCRVLQDRMKKAGINNLSIQYVHNGIACPDNTNPESRTRIRTGWGVPDDSAIPGMIGRIEEQKNPWLFLDLVDALYTKGKIRKAVWIGDGRLREEFAGRARKRGLGNVLIIDGWRSGRDKWDRMHAIDIFVLTSRYEGLPLAILEAMYAGLPVCATNIGGIDEVITQGENGYLCDPGDKNSWIHCLEKLVDNPDLRERMGILAQSSARKQFSIENMARETLSIYNHVRDQTQ